MDQIHDSNAFEEAVIGPRSATTACVAVAGMHRSGTSLVASVLGDAGVDLGRGFLAANSHNQRGYFEDRRFVDLHDAMLGANGTDWALTGCTKRLHVPDHLRRSALELVSEREEETLRAASDAGAVCSAQTRAWGWKDPRTTLFLDFWLELLPSLSVVVPFRDAASVVASLRRRRDLPLQHRFHGAWPLRKLGLPMTRDRAAIQLWETYNNHALWCAERYPGRVAFVDGTRTQSELPRVLGWLRDVRGVSLSEQVSNQRLEPALLTVRPPLDLRLRTTARATVAATMRSLRAASGAGT